MRLLYLIFVVAVIASKEARDKPLEQGCQGIEVRGRFYTEKILAKGLNRPYQLTYYTPRQELYFSYNVGKDEEDKFEIGWLDENGTSHERVEAVKYGFAIAVDEPSGTVYFGGSDGICRSKQTSHTNMSSIIEKYNIWHMFFKRHLYFISYPSQRLYKYKDRKNAKPKRETKIHEKIYNFAIDGDDDIFITNKTGLYMIKNGTEHRHLYEGEKVFIAIALNREGEAYFCGQNGIYVPIKHNHTLYKIAHINNIFGLTFDSEDQMIYSNPHQIVKLQPSLCIELSPLGVKVRI